MHQEGKRCGCEEQVPSFKAARLDSNPRLPILPSCLCISGLCFFFLFLCLFVCFFVCAMRIILAPDLTGVRSGLNEIIHPNHLELCLTLSKHPWIFVISSFNFLIPGPDASLGHSSSQLHPAPCHHSSETWISSFSLSLLCWWDLPFSKPCL